MNDVLVFPFVVAATVTAVAALIVGFIWTVVSVMIRLERRNASLFLQIAASLMFLFIAVFGIGVVTYISTEWLP